MRNSLIILALSGITLTMSLLFKPQAKYLFLLAIALLAPILYILLLVGFFIVADTVYGIYAAKKMGVKIVSSRLSDFIPKMLGYQLVVISAYALDVLLLGEFFLMFVSIPLVVTKLVALMLCSNELYSIDESLKNATGNGIYFRLKKMLKIARTLKRERDEFNGILTSAIPKEDESSTTP